MKYVLVSQSFSFIKKRNEIRDFIDIRLVSFLKKCNLNIILIPNNYENLKNLLKIKKIKGIILSGGNDIFYNLKEIKKDFKIKKLSKNRNSIEKKLVSFATKKKLPVIGICRGFQYLNVLGGGKITRIKDHVAIRHKIKIQKSNKYSSLKKLIAKNVNSFHNFGIKDNELSKKFDILAFSKNLVEAAINQKESQLGIMWHPEREKKFNNKDILLFKKFLRA